MGAAPSDGDTRLAERFRARRDQAARAIERASLELIVERGFDAVSVDDLAAAAGISQRTFFRYFSSKDDVVLGYRRRLDERLFMALERRPADEGPVTALRNAFLETSTLAPADRRDVLARARAVAATPALMGRSRGEQVAAVDSLAALLAARAGANPHDLWPAVVAATMSAAAVVAWEQWVATGVGDPASRIVASLDLVQRGLDALEGVAR